MRNVILSALTLLVCSVSISAQVTIGLLQEPRAGAGLDLNSNSKGLLLPNVSLSNPATTFQLDGGDPAKAKGMTVYNTSNNLNGPGVYVWDGKQWILITCEPETPGAIDLSPTTVNLNGTFTASVPEVTTGTQIPTSYAWTLPGGLTGTSMSHSITITGATAGSYASGTIKVTATNDCGISAERTSTSAVTVRDCTGAPSTPTLSITATTINRNGTTTLSCTDVGNGTTTYAWTLPAGLTGSSTTRSITVTGATAGTYNASAISVKATNDCGTASATGSGGAITVRDCTGAPAMLTLSVTATSVDKGATFALSCTDVGNGATAYEWTLPEGLTGSSTTNTIKVTASTIGMYAANQIKVTATNACGSMTATGSGGAITVVLCSGATVYNGAYNGPAAGAYNTSYGGTFSANWTASAFTAQGKDLCWAASDISGKKTWEAATEACAGDWRLPNLKELQVLYEAIGGTGKSSATALTALDTKGTGTANGASAMQSVISNYYFSSTEASSDLAYTFIFNNGARYSRNKTTSYYVRCVRSL